MSEKELSSKERMLKSYDNFHHGSFNIIHKLAFKVGVRGSIYNIDTYRRIEGARWTRFDEMMLNWMHLKIRWWPNSIVIIGR